MSLLSAPSLLLLWGWWCWRRPSAGGGTARRQQCPLLPHFHHIRAQICFPRPPCATSLPASNPLIPLPCLDLYILCHLFQSTCACTCTACMLPGMVHTFPKHISVDFSLPPLHKNILDSYLKSRMYGIMASRINNRRLYRFAI